MGGRELRPVSIFQGQHKTGVLPTQVYTSDGNSEQEGGEPNYHDCDFKTRERRRLRLELVCDPTFDTSARPNATWAIGT